MAGSVNTRNGTRRGSSVVENVSICGFKSMCDTQRLELRPLTVLAGANSSGKSSIMQPLLLMKQTLEAPFDPGALLLDGPNVRITSTEQLLSKVAGCQCPDSFIVNFGLSHERALEVTFKRVPAVGVRLASMVSVEGQERLEFHEDMSSSEVEALLPAELRRMGEEISLPGLEKPEWVVQRNRCFLSLGMRFARKGREQGVAYWPSASPARWVLPFLEGFIHVPGLRGNPERTYKTTAVGSNFPGTFEIYVASVVASWQSVGDPRLKALGKVLAQLGLTWKIEAKTVDETRVELRVGRLPQSRRGGAHDMVSIADVGFGVSQALPVVVALLAARKGQVVYVEQPEIHLHPRAQRALAQVLADAVERGVVVVVETHSSLLLRGIQTLVAKGPLRPRDVGLHWFRREPETGATKVARAELDRRGSFGDWPGDFDDVALEAESAYLDAAEAVGRD